MHVTSPVDQQPRSSLLSDITMEALPFERRLTPTPDSDMVEVPIAIDTNSLSREDKARIPSGDRSLSSARLVPRLHTKTSSIAGPLPWTVDETGSPSTASLQKRVSLASPSHAYNHQYSSNGWERDTARPWYYSDYTPSSPNASGRSQSSSMYTPVNLSHPPGYQQNALSSFCERPTQMSSPTYSNSSPFYQNSHNSIFGSPVTPSRRGRGILDDDPSIYLEATAEEGMWDTATKWAKAAGKRVSEGEQQIWKMVNAMTTNGRD